MEERTGNEPPQMRDYYLLIVHSYLYGIVSARSLHSILFYSALSYILPPVHCSYRILASAFPNLEFM